MTSVINYTVDMGNNVTFQCVATGIPAPSITWFRSGTQLTGPRVEVDDHSEVTVANIEGEAVMQISHNLTLSMTEDDDSGTYECRASNGAMPGEDAETFELIVQSKFLP